MHYQDSHFILKSFFHFLLLFSLRRKSEFFFRTKFQVNLRSYNRRGEKNRSFKRLFQQMRRYCKASILKILFLSILRIFRYLYCFFWFIKKNIGIIIYFFKTIFFFSPFSRYFLFFHQNRNRITQKIVTFCENFSKYYRH